MLQQCDAAFGHRVNESTHVLGLDERVDKVLVRLLGNFLRKVHSVSHVARIEIVRCGVKDGEVCEDYLGNV